MPVFVYKAIDTDASVLSGTVAAETPRHARDILRDRGLTIETIQVATEKSGLAKLLRRFRSRDRAQLATFARDLSTLLAVGIPLLDSLDTLIRQHKGRFQRTLLQLRERVASGAGLAAAMQDRPDIFDAMATTMVAIGENTGTLDIALGEWADAMERSQALRGRIGTALIYPCAVLLIGVAVSLFLMTYVIPSLLKSLTEAGKPLPWPTMVVKTGSDFLRAHPSELLLGVSLVVLLVGAGGRTVTGRRLLQRAILRIPLLGDTIRKQTVARIAAGMASLLRSGCDFMHAIRVVRQSLKNYVIRDALASCERSVESGREIGVALEETKVFPPMVVQVFSVGQQSGKLEEMLDRLSQDYHRQVDAACQRLTSLLEPTLIVLLAIFVGFLAFATILPLLEAGNVLS